jgi:uncharacterized protein (UPF0210 family)
MLVSEQLKIVAVKMNISIAEMARRCDKSPQTFWQKIKRETFTTKELIDIATKLGIKYESHFVLKDGEKV